MPFHSGFAFGPFQIDPASRRLTRDTATVALTDRQFTLLHALVGRAGDVVSKDELVRAVWLDVHVGDNNLVQMIRHLRRVLDANDPDRYILTVARRGYRFVAPVSRVRMRPPEADLEALLAPERAWIAGRAALETLDRAELSRARSTFEALLAHHEDEAAAHAGLATSCALAFEATRTDPAPDVHALREAEEHAREACRLNLNSGEAWATLGFVMGLDGRGDRAGAIGALLRSVMLEPDNWRHWLRLSFTSWEQRRLNAARRALTLMPGALLARWLAATVFVARGALEEAERELDAGLAGAGAEPGAHAAFSRVALHWLKGLLALARGAEDEAIALFERELALESSGHLFAPACAANAWYAIGACRLRQRNEAAARAAFEQALARVPAHPMARAGLALLGNGEDTGLTSAGLPHTRFLPSGLTSSVDAALAQAVPLVARGDAPAAARLVGAALVSSPPGNAGWILPVEPLLCAERDRDAWKPVLAHLCRRAA